MSGVSAAVPRRTGRPLRAWWALAAAGFVLLPWYFPQNLTLLRSIPGVFGGAETAGGLVQAAVHGRTWLWLVPAALALAAVGVAHAAGRAQGRWLVAGAGGGVLGPVATGFAIGAQGWSFDALRSIFGELPVGQFGIGPGGALVLFALLALLGAGIARLGFFRGDFFVAGAVVCYGALLLLFVALPVGKSLVGALADYGVALAYCTVLIALMSAATAAIQAVVGERKLGRRAAR